MVKQYKKSRKGYKQKNYQNYISITAKLEKAELETAYTNALNLMRDLYEEFEAEYPVDVDKPFIDKLYLIIK